MCRLLGVSSSGFYDWLGRPVSAHERENAQLLQAIKHSHEASDGTYGSPRVVRDLIDAGFACNKNRVEGVRVVSAKRKMGEDEVTKLREWSPRLRTVVARAKQAHTASRLFLFANAKRQPYTKSGWGSLWADAMFDWIASFDGEVAAALVAKREWEVRYRAARKAKAAIEPYEGDKITEHPEYFALSDDRPQSRPSCETGAKTPTTSPRTRTRRPPTVIMIEGLNGKHVQRSKIPAGNLRSLGCAHEVAQLCRSNCLLCNGYRRHGRCAGRCI
jgi:hypothetical protein